MPKIAVVSFPGNNCEVESLRALRRVGIETFLFRWNDSHEKLQGVDGYFLPGGFSYEDRGRAGMVAARDPLLNLIGQEAEAGKVVLGHCNGAQILVESGIIPLNTELKMSLADNVVDEQKTGFLNEWVWVKPVCGPERCATSNWNTPIHMPIAHGEGRFTTTDIDVLDELKANNQLAFHYCTADGEVSDRPPVTPNGSAMGIAGICNPMGNVVALMPHPERTITGDPYFASVKTWIEQRGKTPYEVQRGSGAKSLYISESTGAPEEVFIETIITNNEERTLERVLQGTLPAIELKQLRYYGMKKNTAEELLRKLSNFNPNKERAYIQRDGKLYAWKPDTKQLEAIESSPFHGELLLRTEPFQNEAMQIGTCYICKNCTKQDLQDLKVSQVFANIHASFLVFLKTV